MRVQSLFIKVLLLLLWAVVPVSAQNSYTLQKALQTAKTNNPVLKTQYYNVGIAGADTISARLLPNPSLNNQSLVLTNPSYYPANTRWNNGLNQQIWWQLTMPVPLPNQRKYKINAADQNLMLSRNYYHEIERNLFQEVALKWVDVWITRKQLDILQIAKSNADSLVAINKFRLKNQVITQTDFTRTELLANQYALQIRSAEQNYNNEIINLKFLLGIQEEISIDTSDNFLLVSASGLDLLLQQALNSRSDVLTLKSAIEAANSNVELQKALAWPSPELGVIYNPQNTIPYLGFFGTIALPVFDRNQGEIEKSNLLKEQAEQELMATQWQIQNELTIAYNTYQLQKQNLEKYNTLLMQSETILTNVKYSYLRGGTTIIDYLEAQRSWLDTQQQYYYIEQEYKQSYIKLLYTSGLINQMAQ